MAIIKVAKSNKLKIYCTLSLTRTNFLCVCEVYGHWFAHCWRREK